MKFITEKFIGPAKRLLAALFIVIAAFQTAPRLRADSASTFIQSLLAYNGGVTITMTSINVNGSVGYSQFYMTKVLRPSPHLQGTAAELFNDRVNGHNSPIQPFDIAQADKVQLDISANEIALKLLSWNNGTIVFSPSLEANVLYGWSSNGNTYFALSCAKVPPIQ